MTRDDLINQWIDITYWFLNGGSKIRSTRTEIRKSVENMLANGKLPTLAKKISELEKDA